MLCCCFWCQNVVGPSVLSCVALLLPMSASCLSQMLYDVLLLKVSGCHRPTFCFMRCVVVAIPCVVTCVVVTLSVVTCVVVRPSVVTCVVVRLSVVTCVVVTLSVVTCVVVRPSVVTCVVVKLNIVS